MQGKANAKTPVLVCGLLTADVVFNVDAIPSGAVKYIAENVSLNCGGGGCYAAVAINRLGGSSAVLAKIGEDDFGKVVLATLESEGINHTNVVVDPHIRTPISSIALDPTGERQIVNYRDRTPTAFTDDLLFSTSPGAVLVDARWIEGSVCALEYAKSNVIPGVVDAESPVSERTLALATHSVQGARAGITVNAIAPGYTLLTRSMNS